MEFLKVLFENGAVTWEQFQQGVSEKGIKIADLSEGNYVSKLKYDDDIKAKDGQISDLNENIKTRDTDLADLKRQLEEAGNDKAKLSELTGRFDTLQADYDNAKTSYEEKLEHQKYEFAVKEFANAQKFTSGAAKREFVRSMTEKALKMKDDVIQGADDYLEKYKTENADSFAAEDGDDKQPSFAGKSSGGSDTNKQTDPFLSGFEN